MYEKHEFKLQTEKIPLYTPPESANITLKKKQPLWLRNLAYRIHPAFCLRVWLAGLHRRYLSSGRGAFVLL